MIATGTGGERDDRRPPALQENQHDDGDEQNRVAEGLVYLEDRITDEGSRVVTDFILDAVGKILGEPGHRLFDLVAGLEGVGAGEQEEGEADGGLEVEAVGDVLQAGAELEPGHVFELHGDAARPLDFHHDFAEFFHRGEPAESAERDLLHLAFAGRRLADLPRCHLGVLLLESVADVECREIAGGQLLGIDPDAHGIIALAEKSVTSLTPGSRERSSRTRMRA